MAAAARRRRWIEPQAQRVFAAALLAFSVLSSVYFLGLQAGRWDARLDAYRQVGHLLDARTPADARVLAVDPPGLWYASGRETIVIPSDGFDALLAAAQTFDARNLIVEASGPTYLAPLWVGTEPVAGFTCLGTTDLMAVYAVDPSRLRPPSLCPPVPGRARPSG